jgi:hypothetical protein
MTGYRVWRLDGDHVKIRSLTLNLVWPRGVMTAKCEREWWLRPHIGPWGKPVHEAPDRECECGIYSTQTLWDALLIGRIEYPYHKIVVGEVEIWGRIVEHKKGYRSEFAQITRFYQNQPGENQSGEVDEISRFYDVPVMLAPAHGKG